MAGAALRAVGTTTGSSAALVAVGDDGYAARSTDVGVNWTEITITSGSPDFIGCAGSPSFGHFIVIRSDATTSAYRSADDGATWVALTLPSAVTRQAIFCFSTLGYVILQGTGISWSGSTHAQDSFTDATGPGANTLRGAVYVSPYLYVCGDAGLLARTDFDTSGVSATPTWETLTSGTADDLNSISVSPDGLLVAVGESGRVVYSEDGSTWATATNADTDHLYAVQHDGVNRWTANGATLESVESYQGLFNHGTMVVTTHWVKIGGPTVWGQGRCWRATLLAKRLGPHGLQVDIGYDYLEEWVHTRSWTGDEIEDITDDDQAYELAIVPPRQVCSAIRFRFTELTPAEFTYGTQLTNLILDIGVRQGGAKKLATPKLR